MANIATDPRPPLCSLECRAVLLAAFVLAVFAVVPWRHHGPERVVASLDFVKRPPVIVAMELEPPPSAGLLGALADLVLPTAPGVIEPAEHPDAHAWPRGMVIRPPAGLDRMTIELPGVLDRTFGAVLDKVLSALFGDHRTTAS